MQDIRYEYEQMRLAFFRAPLFVHTENENMILKPEDTDKVSLDDYHRHEARDRTAIFTDQFETHVASHPAIDYDPKLKSMAEEIADKLAALYQSIGQLSNATVNREPDG